MSWSRLTLTLTADHGPVTRQLVRKSDKQAVEAAAPPALDTTLRDMASEFSPEVLEQMRRQQADTRAGKVMTTRDDVLDLAREIGLSEADIKILNADSSRPYAPFRRGTTRGSRL